MPKTKDKPLHHTTTIPYSNNNNKIKTNKTERGNWNLEMCKTTD